MTAGPVHCKKCGSDHTTPVDSQGLIELVARLFYVYPIRCKVCGLRFLTFNFGVRYVADDIDKRQHARVDTAFPIGISLKGNIYAASSIDVSVGGCSLETESPIQVGDVVTISLQMFDDREPIWVEAAVVRSRQDGGYGVEFLKMDDTDREDLEQYIKLQLALSS